MFELSQKEMQIVSGGDGTCECSSGATSMESFDSSCCDMICCSFSKIGGWAFVEDGIQKATGSCANSPIQNSFNWLKSLRNQKPEMWNRGPGSTIIV